MWIKDKNGEKRENWETSTRWGGYYPVVFTKDNPWIGKGQSLSYPDIYPISTTDMGTDTDLTR